MIACVVNATLESPARWRNGNVCLQSASSLLDRTARGKPLLRVNFWPRRPSVVHFVKPGFDRQRALATPSRACCDRSRPSLFLRELDRLAGSIEDFAFESTLSGLTYMNRLKRWKATGRRIEIAYLRISSPHLALRRIAARVKQGGHYVPRPDVQLE